MEEQPKNIEQTEPKKAECKHPTYRPDSYTHWREFFCDTCGAQLHKTELHGRTNLGVKLPS